MSLDGALGNLDAKLEELSPWMRGAPHRGFAAAIFLIRAAISEGWRGSAAVAPHPSGSRRPVLAGTMIVR
jgi:hypothetical protein